jgi:isoleucyl-tRNA synthetase
VSKACDQYTLKLGDAGSGCFVGVKKAGGVKCERCWFWSDTVGTHEGLDGVCPRCAGAVHAKGGLPKQEENKE